MNANELKEHCLRVSEEDSKTELVKIPLDFFGIKSGKKEARELGEIPPKPINAYSFLNKERQSTRHHKKHALDMGYKNQAEYEKAAIDFWEKGEGTVYYSFARKCFCKYDRKKKVVISADGIIHTFMLENEKKFLSNFKWERYEKI